MELLSGWAWCLEQERLARDTGQYKDLVIDWIEQAVDEAGSRAVARLTQAAWPRARLEVRRRLLQSLGLDPLPPRVTITPPRRIGTLDGDGYVVERLVLEPRPNFLMPIHLYVPKAATFPAPAILYAPGHWMIHGKAEPDIQACCIGLAKLGFVVLVFDPMGQGERGAAFEDHARRDLLLLGLSQEGMMAWESMLAIDYLLTRPEVDGNRIGMTGASGGGLNTIYTCAADERIAVSVPVCYVTSFSRFFRAMRGLNWNNQNDLCNQVPNVIGDAEMAGLCGLIHPRPLMVIAGTLDPQFPVDGAQEVIDQLTDIYAAVGPERLRLAAIDADHGYDRAMREAAYGWFRRWLQGEGDGSPIPEPPLVGEPPDSPDLKCFPGTPAIRSWPAIRTLAHTYRRVVVREPALPGDGAGWAGWRASLRQDLGACLGVVTSGDAPGAVAGRADGPDSFERHLIEPEPGIVVPAFVARPAGPPTWSLVYLCDQGKLAGPGPDLLSAGLAEGGLVMALDPRGLGETQPLPPPTQTVATLDGKLDQRPTLPADTLEFEAATDALMLGRSLFGQQLSDLLAGINYAARLAHAVPLIVVGSGPIAGLLALYAGALSDRVAGVLADGLLPSYHLLVEEDEQFFPITAYVFRILRVADVAQVAGAIAPRPLLVTRPLDACLQALVPAEAARLLQWTDSAYRRQSAPLPAVLPALSAQALIELVRQTQE